MNPLKAENREVAGRSIMVDDEGQPMLVTLRMHPPEDGEAFGSEIEALIGFPIEDPAALTDEIFPEGSMEGLPEEMPEALREAVLSQAAKVRESMLARLEEQRLVPLPCHACGACGDPTLTMGMN